MLSDKEVKKEFKKKASLHPEQYYSVSFLKTEGFQRAKCANCGIFFWSTEPRITCGDPACSGGFGFLGKSPAKNKLDYIQIWEKFSALFKNVGYTPIERYPVAARWREDTAFVQASIYDFQPYVVSGEVEPPANPLVVPQLCLRFNDIDNIGITGSHFCLFDMIGQHAFMPPETWDQEKYFSDIHSWLLRGLGLPKKEIVYHEDAWAGGGNFGPCMEFFSRGLELGNQVYMLYEKTPTGYRELKLKVLDMGMGHERNAWFTMGKATSYESTFPTVMEKLRRITGLAYDQKLMQQFLPYAGCLNVDETDNINAVWDDIAKKLGVDKAKLKQMVLPNAALYSVAEHSRALLVALNDGILPSNTGGGYNLRAILRRALGFIDQHDWDIDLKAVAEWHAEYLKKLFPELQEHLADVHKILDVEKAKYGATRQRVGHLVQQYAKKGIDEKTLISLYDSQGMSPELLQHEANRVGIDVKIPDNFYAKVAELHEQQEQKGQTTRKEVLDFGDVPDTKALYYDDWKKHSFEAKVVGVKNGYVILDQTYFYPTSGGQLHDKGTLQGIQILDVFKQGGLIVHVLEKVGGVKVGQRVSGVIDGERRLQLAQHHTTAHIINAAARTVLGHHVNQASAYKDLDKGRIDITHYAGLRDEEVVAIEQEANTIVQKSIPMHKEFMERGRAEKSYGLGIYQGGVVPGKNIRIVEIPGVDIEACGGTHLDNTAEAGKIKILKATKISDGIVRLEYVAGKAAEQLQGSVGKEIEEAARLLKVPKEMVPGRAHEVFELWKDVVKKGKKRDVKLTSTEKERLSDDDLLKRTAMILKTQPEHVFKTLQRFLKELGV